MLGACASMAHAHRNRAINGGFGLLIDGSDGAEMRIRQIIAWDVTNGLARRAWAANAEAIFATRRAMDDDPQLRVTLPHEADDELVKRTMERTERG